MAAAIVQTRSGIRIVPLTEHLGAEIDNVDLSRPITPAQYEDVNDALVAHSVLVFRDQDLPPAMHVDFSARFGRLVGHIFRRFSVEDFPEVT